MNRIGKKMLEFKFGRRVEQENYRIDRKILEYFVLNQFDFGKVMLFFR